MKLLPTELTTFEDKMKDLTTNGVKFADSFANLDFMKKAKEIQTSSRAAMQTKEAFKNLQQSIKTTGEELLMSQRGNIISMIRESANANGEFFLENVNTGAIPNQGELR